MEQKAITQVNKALIDGLVTMINDSFCEEWNYITSQGKQYATLLRNGPKSLSYKESSAYNETRVNYYEWPIFQNYDSTTLMTLC